MLADTDRPLRDRLVESFDHWAGRYVSSLSRNISAVIDDNPDILGTIVQTKPQQFERLITDAIAVESEPDSATRVAKTLISTAIGIKHQVD